MLNQEKLLNHPEIDSICRGGEMYIRRRSVSKFINLCGQNNIAIVGIEGFNLSGEKIIPDMNLIADLSCSKGKIWSDYMQNCNDSTIMFFDQMIAESNLIFSFTLLSEHEWNL